MRKTLEERLWDKVSRRGEDDCWEWSAYSIDGYGRIYDKGRLVLAHRVSWEINNGPIPSDMHCLHKCDNPSCVNPGHLFLGDHSDNMRDMGAKGRSRASLGGTNDNSKLTEESVIEIRRMAACGNDHKWLASLYGVMPSCISKIVTYRTWSHI